MTGRVPVVPEACHLWRAANPTLSEVAKTLEIVKTFVSQSHVAAHTCRCRECGQIYFHVWFETLDWEEGGDKMRDIYVPAADEFEAEALSKLAPPPESLDILGYVPRLQSNDAGKMEWVGKVSS